MASDREKLMELIRQCRDYLWGREIPDVPTEDKLISDFLIANGVTVQKWIPVTERLPVVQGYYMVYHKNSKTIAERFYYKDCPDLFVEVTGDPVTHWMPLPKKPKEGEA